MRYERQYCIVHNVLFNKKEKQIYVIYLVCINSCLLFWSFVELVIVHCHQYALCIGASLLFVFASMTSIWTNQILLDNTHLFSNVSEGVKYSAEATLQLQTCTFVSICKTCAALLQRGLASLF